jgi:hypothetical protein
MASVALLVAYAGCGLNGVQVPDLVGPAELATSLQLTASPDVIVADGFSTSLITATVRDQNGRPSAGRDVFFSVADATGHFADIGDLRSLDTGVGVGTGLQVRTNAQGIAAVVYEAPARTDATANQTVLVSARPVGTDANGALYRTVRIELRQAEPRLFPQNPNGDIAPHCDFTVEVTGKSSCPTPTSCTIPVNTSVLFQSTAFDPDGVIVRYFWSFGNGKTADHPDVSTSYSIAGTYTVTHLVTDNNGSQAACAATITAR